MPVQASLITLLDSGNYIEDFVHHCCWATQCLNLTTLQWTGYDIISCILHWMCLFNGWFTIKLAYYFLTDWQKSLSKNCVMVKACVWPFVNLLNMWGWPNPLLCVISVMWTLSRLNSEARMDSHILTHCMHKKYTFVWSIVMPNIATNNLIWLDECQTFKKAPHNKEFTFESKLFVRRCFVIHQYHHPAEPVRHIVSKSKLCVAKPHRW